MLVCSNCGSVNRDPGGDPALYTCGVCGQATLQRAENIPSGNNNTIGGAVVGATVGGFIGGPVGAVLGILFGGVFGAILK
jgi:hypothetical protein